MPRAHRRKPRVGEDQLARGAKDLRGVTVAIRADASILIGTGHVMRCLTLADFLRSEGAEVRFVSRALPGSLEHEIEARGFAVSVLRTPGETYGHNSDPDDYAAWLGVGQETDANETIDILAGNGAWDWLVVDHYGIDHRWQTTVRPYVGQVFVIDDLANRRHECDALLDANFTYRAPARYAQLVPDRCRMLLGPAYSLLRDEFRNARAMLSRGNGKLERILIFFGGVDRPNLTVPAVRGAVTGASADVAIEVIAGANNPHWDELSAECAKCEQVSLFRQVDDMARRMADADLAIGAGGTTTWERCALGLPALIAAVAENQEAIGQEAERYGVAKYLGHASSLTVDDIARNVRQLVEEPERLTRMSRAALELVDGRGVERVSNCILACQAEEARV
ncbi:UDP-2,4-diacetamido-2,4,6-trideoxy-beta-L-altropyranose hydrolase [candidate division GN15 bacterium]|nr:UDP-2,4-diacetamido-2,4,6-trideoxy-beta-L-altropyranose hydrolase [candidate division GN15 bacterium]